MQTSLPGAMPPPPPTPVVAAWVRDDAYGADATRYALMDRPAWARALAPLGFGLALALVFSSWGAMPAIFGRQPLAPLLPMLVLCVLLLALGAVQTYPSQLKGMRRQFAFAGDAVRWEFDASGTGYGLKTAEGAQRHAARSEWGWFRLLSVDVTGLRLHRRGSAEAYFIPAHAFAQPDQDGPAAMARVVALAQAAGLATRHVVRRDRAGLAGAAVMAVLLVGGVIAQAAFVAAWSLWPGGRMEPLFARVLAQFGWLALPAGPLALAAHLGLAAWQCRRRPAPDIPALVPHLLLALGWCVLLLAALHGLRGQAAAPLLAARSGVGDGFALLHGLIFALLAGFVLHRTAICTWAARHAAVHNGRDRLHPLEPP